MFPLGQAPLPGEALPLRIFEPRYLEMMEDLGGVGGEFGSVLISRGSEVGGGEQRTSVGTLVKVVTDVPLAADQRAIVGVGVDRIRVVDWLPDDPYPQAAVEAFADVAGTAPAQEAIAELGKRVERLYALASELGADTSDQDFDLPADAAAAMWRLCSLVPLGAHDRQRLLELDDGMLRERLLASLIDDVATDLTLRLGER